MAQLSASNALTFCSSYHQRILGDSCKDRVLIDFGLVLYKFKLKADSKLSAVYLELLNSIIGLVNLDLTNGDYNVR